MSNIIKTTEHAIKKVFAELGRKPTERDSFALTAKIEISKIVASQKQEIVTPANNMYEQAGFKANSITARMVQNQIAYGRA